MILILSCDLQAWKKYIGQNALFQIKQVVPRSPSFNVVFLGDFDVQVIPLYHKIEIGERGKGMGNRSDKNYHYFIWAEKNLWSTPLDYSMEYFWTTFGLLLDYFWTTFRVPI